MTYATKKLTSDERRSLVTSLRTHHEQVFETLCPNGAYFYPKVVFTRSGVKIVTFFPSELSKETDIFTEFVDFEYNPTDPSRTLYRWRYNPYFAQELQREGHGDQLKYVVPVEELQKVTITKKHVAELSLSDLKDEGIDRLTIRDLYAIIQNRPVSKKGWLNETIRSN